MNIGLNPVLRRGQVHCAPLAILYGIRYSTINIQYKYISIFSTSATKSTFSININIQCKYNKINIRYNSYLSRTLKCMLR